MTTNLTTTSATLTALGTSPVDTLPVHQSFNAYLIGALASAVDADTWAECLATATACVESAREGRAA